MDMKKVLGIGIILMVMLLSACGNDEEVNTESKEDESSVEQESNEPSQEELDEQLKEEATEADFVKVNGGEVEEGAKLFAEGEVSHADEEIIQQFTLTTKSGDGYGMYTVKSIADEVSDGDQVKVYGTYD